MAIPSGGAGLPRGPGARPAARPAPKPPTRPTPPPAVGGIPANSPLLNPSQTVSGPALYQEARALAQAQTNPAIQSLQQMMAQNSRQSTGAENLTGGYFNQLMGQANAAAGRVAQQGTDLNSQLAQIAQDENSQLQGLGSNAQGMLAKYSPEAASGAGMQSLASEIARMQGLAAQEEGTQRAYGATQGANYSGLANSQVGTGALKGIEDLNQIAQAGQIKNAPLADKIAQLVAQRGALTASNLGKLRQQEITNNITEQGLGIKKQDLQLQRQAQAFNMNPNAPGSPANQRVTSGRVAQQNANTSAQNATTRAQSQQFNQNPTAVGSPAWERVQRLQGTQWSQNPSAVGSPAWARVQKQQASSSGGAKPLSTSENNVFWGKMGTIEQLIKDGQAHGESEAAIRNSLATGNTVGKTKYDPFMVQVAYELLGYGSIDQTTAATLHNQYGVRGGTYKNQPIKVTPNYNPNTPAGGAAQVIKSLSNVF